MERQVSSVDRILLLAVACVCLTDHGLNGNGVAASSIACSRDHPGYIKCRAIEADCYHTSSNRIDYKCLCSEGYWMIEEKCQKSDWCAAGEVGDTVCKSNGTVCKKLNWTQEASTRLPYKCECESRFVQSGICSVNDLYCLQRGATVNFYQNITICNCDQKRFFDYSTSKCQNLDLCPFKRCTGKYEVCQGSECICQTGYERIDSECKPKDYCLSNDVCGSAKCEQGPEDDPKRIRCYCDSGYVLARQGTTPYCKLVRCDTQSLNPCDHLCIYSADRKTSRCECLPGHTLKQDGITCEIQASHKCAYNICSSKSICVKLNGTEKCMCKNSLVGEGQRCIDQCAAGLRGTCPGACKSTKDGFQCICVGKYRLSKNQVTCEERQMCIQKEQGQLTCSRKNRTCIESPETEDGFTCGECLHGLQEHQGNCTDLCQVEEIKRYCEDNGATCASVNEVTREVNCKCPPLFTWSKDLGCKFARHSYTGALRIFNVYKTAVNSSDTLRYGEGNIDWKNLDGDVGKSMSALFGQALSEVNVLQCRSDETDASHLVCIICTVELQLHFEDYGILQRLNSQTVCRGFNIVPLMFCFIPPYLQLVPRTRFVKNVEVPFRRSDACGVFYGYSVCPASTECVREDIGFSCRCKHGFTVERTIFLNNDKTGLIEVCQDVNECETSDPCPNGTFCVNTIGNFDCRCKPGLYRWHNTGNPEADICTGACDQVNCIHGTCEEGNKLFYCRCQPGYSGVYCEEKAPEHNDCSTGMGRTAILAVGIVQAIIFVVFILCVALFSRGRYIHRRNRTAEAKDTNIRIPTIEHVHMRNTPQSNGDLRPPVQEETDEPIYADCTHIT